MIDRKLFQKTFSTLHASPDTLSEVYRTVHEEEHKQSLHRRHAISKGVLIAAVLAMCITVAGAAGVSIAGLIKANVTPSASITAAAPATPIAGAPRTFSSRMASHICSGVRSST